MTQAVKRIVDEFEALPEPERQELLAELLRRMATEPHNLPDEQDLIAAADLVLQDLDWRERLR